MATGEKNDELASRKCREKNTCGPWVFVHHALLDPSPIIGAPLCASVFNGTLREPTNSQVRKGPDTLSAKMTNSSLAENLGSTV